MRRCNVNVVTVLRVGGLAVVQGRTVLDVLPAVERPVDQLKESATVVLMEEPSSLLHLRGRVGAVREVDSEPAAVVVATRTSRGATGGECHPREVLPDDRGQPLVRGSVGREVAAYDSASVAEGWDVADRLQRRSVIVGLGCACAPAPHCTLRLNGVVASGAHHLASGNDVLAVRQSSLDRVARPGARADGLAAVAEVYASAVSEPGGVRGQLGQIEEVIEAVPCASQTFVVDLVDNEPCGVCGLWLDLAPDASNIINRAGEPTLKGSKHRQERIEHWLDGALEDAIKVVSKALPDVRDVVCATRQQRGQLVDEVRPRHE